jgi:GMP synthase (glutamine-hydrolysing)
MLLVGGSGAFSVLDTHLSWLRGFMDFLEEVVVGQRFPTFASCFGFQALVTAGGGSVVRDTVNAELGTYDIHLTPEGAVDPLVGVHPAGFKAQLGHKDRADRLPAGCVHLAYSEQVAYQAFRIEGAPVFATQFHPELNREGNAFRCRAYATIYAKSGVADEMKQVIAGLEESPEASLLMPRWVEQVLGSEAV